MSKIKMRVFLLVSIIIILSPFFEAKEKLKYDEFFIENIWEQITKTGIIHTIVQTDFIQGIKSGKLDPYYFGRYLIQDLQYIRLNLLILERTCQDSLNDTQFYQFCQYCKSSYRDFYDWMQDRIFISAAQPMGVVTGYINDMTKTYERNSYHYMPVLFYACLKLYKIIAEQYLLPYTNDQNPYWFWVQDNAQGEDYIYFGQKINQYQNLFDREQVKNDILRFLNYEFQLFKQSCPTQNQIKHTKILKQQ